MERRFLGQSEEGGSAKSGSLAFSGQNGPRGQVAKEGGVAEDETIIVSSSAIEWESKRCKCRSKLVEDYQSMNSLCQSL